MPVPRHADVHLVHADVCLFHANAVNHILVPLPSTMPLCARRITMPPEPLRGSGAISMTRNKVDELLGGECSDRQGEETKDVT